MFQISSITIADKRAPLQESSSPNSAKVGISEVCIDRRYNEATKCSVLSVGSTLKRQIRNEAKRSETTLSLVGRRLTTSDE